MKVRFVHRARQDLDDIAAWIAQHNPAAAMRTVDAITARANQLVDHPESGPSGRAAGTRELVETRHGYTLVYRLRGDTAEVLRVLRGQDWPPSTSKERDG